jgi:hypothetical protein
MGIFNKFSPLTPASQGSVHLRPGTPDSEMTEMTEYSRSTPSRQSSLLSSASSVVTSAAQSSYSSRKAEKAWVHDINKHSLMAKHIYRNCKKNNWVEEKVSEACVALRTFQGEYILFPPEAGADTYERAVKGLNVEACPVFNPFDNRSVYESIRMSSKS